MWSGTTDWKDWLPDPERPAWHALAACLGAGPDLFFPPAEGSGRHLQPSAYEVARAYCSRCPVIAECDEAGRRERDGMWAGLTPAERDRRHPPERRTG